MNGLDNLDARRHVNRLCLAAEVPLVESGTTGFLGQVRCSNIIVVVVVSVTLVHLPCYDVCGYWYVGLSYFAGSAPVEVILSYQVIGPCAIFKKPSVVSFTSVSKPAVIFTFDLQFYSLPAVHSLVLSHT
jgi:hypothetical protein